jgi:phosphoribosylformylglycinamidine synthase
VEKPSFTERNLKVPAVKAAKPKALITAFPGTNCEYDTAAAVRRAGGEAKVILVRNLTGELLEETLREMVKSISESNMLIIPGGFSGGDEPEGSGKFISAFFRNPVVAEQVMRLLNDRDGLILGICNGFQALIKLGLVPYGEIRPLKKGDPTLTYNLIGRHQSRYVTARIASVKSPWLRYTEVGDLHVIPISHGEGRFIADEETVARLIQSGQVATQYADLTGEPTMDSAYNPNSSVCAIEGITSPDGRVFGKMGHTERNRLNTGKNVPGNKLQKLFEAGVDYFR